jgi:hypothetical protein
MDPEHIDKIKQWVTLDNKVQKSKEAIKSVQDDKKALEEEILDYVASNNCDKLVINISDGTIKFAKKTTQQSISMKYLKDILRKFSEEKQSIPHDILLKYITDNLEKHISLTMKRDIKS